jgi:hypothetical protein
MSDVVVYAVDPESLRTHQMAAWVIWACVAVFCALAVARSGWRSWWAVIGSLVVLPTIVMIAFGGAPPDSDDWLGPFFGDVMAPLVLLALPAAAAGSLVGAVVRWRRAPSGSHMPR